MRKFDRQLWLVLLLSAVVLGPRSAMIMQRHTETMDTQFHLRLGLAAWMGTRDQLLFRSNDPPLGQMILALPMLVTGCTPDKPIHEYSWPKDWPKPGERTMGGQALSADAARYERLIRPEVLYGNRLRPETILILIALWKAILFVPCAGMIFHWCRQVYGSKAAWLTVAMALFDPTITANVAIAALDTLALEGIVLACFLMWRYFRAPTTPRLIAVAIAMAAAMLLKHTAVILPGIFLIFAAYYWVWIPWRRGERWEIWRATLRPRVNALALAVIVGLFAMWALLLFDISPPMRQIPGSLSTSSSKIGDVLNAAMERRWPAGTYIGCFVSGFMFNSTGQWALLWGRMRPGGWWYYFPAIATMKVPMGFAIVIALALFSLLSKRRRWFDGEESIVIPLLAYFVFLMFARMNYGFRHFLPAYVFILMWAGRSIARANVLPTIIAWAGVVAGAVHAATFHPDYLSYVNFPRREVWMRMTDSNIDWGQAIRQTRDWLDRHPQGDRVVHFAPRWDRTRASIHYYLDERVHLLDRGETSPRSGLLIISPVWVSGVYDDGKSPYAFVQGLEPIDVIRHSLLVYDLDAASH